MSQTDRIVEAFAFSLAKVYQDSKLPPWGQDREAWLGLAREVLNDVAGRLDTYELVLRFPERLSAEEAV